MLKLAAGLDRVELAAVADLERRVVAADGGRLKLEWGTLRSRSGDRAEDLLWWDGDRLVGFLGLYAFGAPVELAGMVDPDRRRRGIGTALVDAALSLCRERADRPVLLVVPRTGAGGREFALGRGGVLDHSEHAMQLTPAGSWVSRGGRITVRPVEATRDGDAVDALLRSGFGPPRPEGEPPGYRDGTLVVERDREVVGTLRVADDGAGEIGVSGFVIRKDLRGQGIGRAVLQLVCGQAGADGVQRVHLEVAVDNDRALTLYTSVGFVRVATEDYYALPGT